MTERPVHAETRLMPLSPLSDVRGHDLLGNLPAPALSRLLASMEACVFAPGEVLFRLGEPASAMLLVVEGAVESLSAMDAVADPALEAPMPFLAGQEAAGLPTYESTVRAVTTIRAWRLPRQAVRALCVQVPGLEAALVRSIERASQAPSAWRDDVAKPALVSNKRLVGWGMALSVPPGLYMATQALDLSLQASVFLAIFGMVITLWVFSLVDDYIPPLAGLICILFVGLAPPSVVLTSFASPSLVTLISVFAMAAMLSGSGLSNRVLLWLLLRLPDRSSWRQVSLLLFGLLLSFGTPSGNNRMALMMPAFDDMARGLRLPERSAAMTALFIATYGGAMLFSSTLATSKSVTISVLGFLPLHLQDYYAGLFWMGAAALFTVGVVALHMLGIRWWVGPQGQSTVNRLILQERTQLLGPLSTAEKCTAVVFVMFLLGSMTTSIHHVPQSGLAGAVLVGLLVCGVMTKMDFQKSIDWPMIVFLISTDCLIKVMGYLGLNQDFARVLGEHVTFVDGNVLVFLGLTLGVVLLIRLLLPIPAGMLLSAVVLLPVAQVEGISPWICIFAIGVFSDIWFFKYQNSIYGIALNAGIAARIQESVFLQHNMWMNGARVLMVFVSVPVWAWMGIA